MILTYIELEHVQSREHQVQEAISLAIEHLRLELGNLSLAIEHLRLELGSLCEH